MSDVLGVQGLGLGFGGAGSTLCCWPIIYFVLACTDNNSKLEHGGTTCAALCHMAVSELFTPQQLPANTDAAAAELGLRLNCRLTFKPTFARASNPHTADTKFLQITIDQHSFSLIVGTRPCVPLGAFERQIL